MKKQFVIIVILTIFFLLSFSVVNGQISIYTPSGEPKIYDLDYSESDISLIANVENLGPEAVQFELVLSCTNVGKLKKAPYLTMIFTFIMKKEKN